MSSSERAEVLRLLDCCCGRGGVSDGFAKEGFDVTGIDIAEAPLYLGYKHRFIKADMLTLKGSDFMGYDVIWESPPCRDFSRMARVGSGSVRPEVKGLWKWKNPPDPQRGLLLVKHFLQFVEDAKPKFWILENVPYLKSFLGIKPRQVTSLTRTMKRAFWGNFPPFLMPTLSAGRLKMDIQGPLRSWERAKIPVVCSSAFARACKAALKN
jgi:site-specific DNA-cytosine methylase